MEDVDYPDSSSWLAPEIEDLQAEVLVYSARASNLHTRLLHAFDALDESQRNHAQELRDLEEKYTRLERRYNRQTVALHTCAAEKDDLRESVLELVEKVEQSNDIRSWPFNRLQLTRSAGSPRQIEPNVRHSPTQEQLSYAGAIIERLRRERDEERVMHVLTREALQSRIDALEARLARRETELEYYNTHAAQRSPVSSERNHVGSPSSTGILDSIPQAMTNEDVIVMLSTTAARNRNLEVEIKTLFKRLHEARTLPFSTEAASPPLPPGHQIPVHSSLQRGLGTTGTRRTPSSSCSDVFRPRSKHDADAFELSNSSSLFTPTPLPKQTPLSDATDDQNVDDDIIPDSWTNLSAASDGVSAQRDIITSGVGVGDGTCYISSPDLGVLGVHDPRRKSAIIAGLDTELEELTAQIDAFRLERESLTQMVTARREYRETQYRGQSSGKSSIISDSRTVRRTGDDPPARPSPGMAEYPGLPFEHGYNQDECDGEHTDRVKNDVFDTLEHRLSVVEGDCMRLRDELSDCRTRAETREQELLGEIQVLQRRVQGLNMPGCRTTPRTPPIPDGNERAQLFLGQDEYRGTQSDVEYLVEDHNSALFEATPTLIPGIQIEDGDLHSLTRETIAGETGQQPPSCPSPHSQSGIDSAPLVPTSGLNPARESAADPCCGLKLDDIDLDKLLDVIDGEASMVLATPLIPSSVLLDRGDSSDGSSAAAAEVNCEGSCDGDDDDGILFDYDIDQDRSEEDMELEGTSDKTDYDEVDDDSCHIPTRVDGYMEEEGGFAVGSDSR